MTTKSKTLPYLIGCAKADITAFVYNKAMMGYAVPFHVVKGVETPISARAFVIKDKQTGSKVCIVNSEICFYTIALKDAVVKTLQSKHPALNYTAANVMLTAQHTHSAPGGYSHHVLYNIAIPGFQPKVFNKIVAGTVAAIVQAEANLQAANIQSAVGAFAPEDEVAFNRTLFAYNANPEVKQKVLKKDHHLAIDRNMKLLRFEDKEGKAIGSINWFGVHTTSVDNKFNKICYDNKGYAAEFLEQDIRKENPHFIGAFAQDTAGDVSPNRQWGAKHGRFRGEFRNDYKSAKFNGKLQYNKAKELLAEAAQNETIKGGIDYELMFADFSNIEVDREFVMGMKGMRTTEPATGVALLKGAQDRPAVPPAVNFFLGVGAGAMSRFIETYEKRVKHRFMNLKDKEDILDKYRLHGRKNIAIETGKGKMFGTYFLKKMIIPGALDITINRIKQMDREGYAKYTPWMPRILPLQIITIGSVAIVGLPAEITTVAGQRLRETVLRTLKHKGVRQVILATYCNGYSGYITTHEEYAKQGYEGGHTLFGMWTLAAYQTKLKQLAIEMLKSPAERNIDKTTQPDLFEEEEIWYG